MRFKLPWDGMEGPEQLLKDFAFIKGTKEGDSVVGGVDVGRRSTLSRVRKAFIKSK